VNNTKLKIFAAIFLVVLLIGISILKVSTSDKKEIASIKPDSALNPVKTPLVLSQTITDSSKIFSDSLRSLLIYYETEIESLKRQKAALADRKENNIRNKDDSNQSKVDSVKLNELTEKYAITADSLKNLLKVKLSPEDSIHQNLIVDYDSLLNMIPDSLHPMDRAEAMRTVIVDLAKKYRLPTDTVQSYIKNRR
jgi:hypothetical protein